MGGLRKPAAWYIANVKLIFRTLLATIHGKNSPPPPLEKILGAPLDGAFQKKLVGQNDFWLDALLCWAVASPRGGQAGQLPPPQPPTGYTVRLMQIRGDLFSCPKNGGRFIGFARTFYMHRRYGGRSLVLRLRKKRKLWKLSKELHGRPSVKLWRPLGSFSPGIGPLKHYIFILFYFYFWMWIWGPSKNSGPNPISFQFLTGGRLT